MSEAYKVALELALTDEEGDAKLPTATSRPRRGAHLSVSSIPVEKVELPPITGRVEGYWDSSIGEEPAQSFLLPDGETIRVPEGSAVSIYSASGGWSDYQMPLGGRLIGPLCYASIRPVGARDLVLKHTYPERSARARDNGAAVFVAGIVGTLGSLLIGTQFVPDAEIGIAVAVSLVTISLLPLLGGLWGSVLAEQRTLRRAEQRECRLPKDIPNPPHHDCDVVLSDRLRSLAGYEPALIEAKLSHYKADDLDRQIEAAASAYKAKRRELQMMAEPDVAAIEHSASMLHEIAQKIAGSPRVLCDRATKEAFLELIGRAQQQVEMRLARKDAAVTADVMADIAALSKQIDRDIG